MTYDERREIGEYLDIVKRNCSRLQRSIDLMQDMLGEMKTEDPKKKEAGAEKSAKEEFLENF